MNQDTQRTDPHRPGAIVPQDYTELFWYDCGGMSEPSTGVNCMKPTWNMATLSAHPGAEDHSHIGCCVLGIAEQGGTWAKTGREHGAGKCTVCGSHFRSGSVWEHTPTGEFIHMGHDCSEKYDLVANITTRREWAVYKKQLERKRSEAAKDMKLARTRDFFIAEHKLEAVFEVREQHHILGDMYSRLHRWGSLSEKQIAFARKLEAEIRNPPPPKPEEVKVPAPIEDGRQTFTGTIVSAKDYDSDYGVSTKITVKMETPDGIWLSWGTCPAGVDAPMDELRGSKITLTARLAAGDDAHFTFFKRPTLVDFTPAPKGA